MKPSGEEARVASHPTCAGGGVARGSQGWPADKFGRKLIILLFLSVGTSYQGGKPPFWGQLSLIEISKVLVKIFFLLIIKCQYNNVVIIKYQYNHVFIFKCQ